MKRLAIFFSIAILLNCYIVAHAQDFNFERALQDYIYNYNLYRAAHLEYVSAKGEYLTYKTLTAQTKALNKTLNMLTARTNVLKTYLTALRMRIKETAGLTDYQKNAYYLKLDNEINWLEGHNNRLPSAGTLEDLVKTSQELENRYPQIQLMAYQSLGTIIMGRETNLRDKIKNQISLTEDKVQKIRETGEDTTVLERWLIQAKEKMNRSEDKEKEVTSLLAKMDSSTSQREELWGEIQQRFEEENQYLKETASYLKEIIREIKSE